jgi:hypothetical protein
MATALVMSPSRSGSHRDDDALQTPVLRLDSIFERTSSSPQLPAASERQGHAQPAAASGDLQHTSSGVSDMPGARGAIPEPAAADSGRAASAVGANVRFEASPSPDPRAGSDASTAGGSPSPDAVSEVGSLTRTAASAGAARRSAFWGAASMSVDQVLLQTGVKAARQCIGQMAPVLSVAALARHAVIQPCHSLRL